MSQVTLMVLLLVGLAGSSVTPEQPLQEVPNNLMSAPAIASSLTTPGFVKDEQAAIAIALKAWIPIYGKKNIEGEKPYVAELKHGVWYVHGSLAEGSHGGVAE